LILSRRDSGKRRPPSDRVLTQAAHAGDDPHRFLGAAAPPVFATSTFVFESFEQAQAAYQEEDQHYFYTRGLNPTTDVAEQKLAALEGGEAARCFASGMGAVSAAILSCVKTGSHIVCVQHAYGPTRRFLSEWLPRFGVETTYVAGTEPAEFAAAIRPNTALIYLESPTSLLFELQDLAAVASLARSRGIRTICDNSWATMLLQRPLDLGVDIVVYTATKHLNGHSDVVAGAVVSDAETVRRMFKLEYQLLGAVLGPH
jgi:cystathionine beta-lyase/cystathionine gamma-synthase